MRPYILDVIAQTDVVLFEKIRATVQWLPDIDLGVDESGEKIILSCHILARAIAKVFGIKYVDGYFYPYFDHTWLITPKGNIIDVYPVGILGGPLLVDRKVLSPTQSLYTAGSVKKLSCRRFGTNSFRRSVRRIERAVRKITGRAR